MQCEDCFIPLLPHKILTFINKKRCKQNQCSFQIHHFHWPLCPDKILTFVKLMTIEFNLSVVCSSREQVRIWAAWSGLGMEATPAPGLVTEWRVVTLLTIIWALVPSQDNSQPTIPSQESLQQPIIHTAEFYKDITIKTYLMIVKDSDKYYSNIENRIEILCKGS